MRALVVSFLVGVVFAVGLGVSGMTQPERVLGFLDFAGRWDATLMFVMAGGVAVHVLTGRLAGEARPLLARKFELPTRRDIDRKLLLGAALFGAGWGLAGICPGPGLVSLASGAKTTVVFVAAMLAGMAIVRLRAAAAPPREVARVSIEIVDPAPAED